MLNGHLSKLLEAQQDGTAIIVIGCRTVDEPADLRKQKQASGGKWTAEQEKQLEATVTRAREGLVFLRCS